MDILLVNCEKLPVGAADDALEVMSSLLMKEFQKQTIGQQLQTLKIRVSLILKLA